MHSAAVVVLRFNLIFCPSPVNTQPSSGNSHKAGKIQGKGTKHFTTNPPPYPYDLTRKLLAHSLTY